MAVIILPDAQNDLLSLQECMLDQWGEVEWLKAENEIFEKLKQVNARNYPGTAVKELTSVGIFEYQYVLTSHHKLLYRQIADHIYVYAIAGQKQDFPSLLMKRLLKR